MENDSTVEPKTPLIMTRIQNQATMPVLEHLRANEDSLRILEETNGEGLSVETGVDLSGVLHLLEYQVGSSMK